MKYLYGVFFFFFCCCCFCPYVGSTLSFFFFGFICAWISLFFFFVLTFFSFLFFYCTPFWLSPAPVMSNRLVHITSHFFDLPSQDVQASAGSPRPITDFPSSSSLCRGSPLGRHGGRSPAAAAAAAARRRGNTNGVANASSTGMYGRPSSPSSSVAITPPQSPAFLVGSTSSLWPTFTGSPSVTGVATVTTSSVAAAAAAGGSLYHPHHSHVATAGASLPSSHVASRTARFADGDSQSRQGSPSSPFFLAASTVGFEGGPSSPTAFRVARPPSRTGAANPTFSGLPSPTHASAAPTAAALAAYAVDASTANTPAGAAASSPSSDPATSQYTVADAELLLHPLLHYVQDERVLRYRAMILRQRRMEVVTVAVDALAHSASCGHKPLALLTQHSITLQHDTVLHARCSRLLACVGRLSEVDAGSPVSSSRVGGEGCGGAAKPSSGADFGGRRSSDLRAGPPRSRAAAAAWTSGSHDSVVVPRAHGASPADSLTSAPGAAASLYLLEMTGQLSGEGAEAIEEAAGTGTEASSPRTDGTHAGFGGVAAAVASTSSPATTLPSSNVRRRRSGSRLSPSAASHDAMAPPLGSSGDAGHHHAPGASNKRPSLTRAAAPDDAEVEGEQGLFLSEEEVALMLSHNVYANYRTLPLQFAHRSYELLPARYRAGLDAISAEVLAQQQQLQRSGGVVSFDDDSGSGGGGGSSSAGCGTTSGAAAAAAAMNSSSNNASGTNHNNNGGCMSGTHGRRGEGNNAAAGYEDVSYIGVSYLSANNDLFASNDSRGGRASPTAAPFLTASCGTRPNSTAPSPHPSMGPRVGAFGEAGMWPSMRADLTASPLPPSRAMEERGGGVGAAGTAVSDDTAVSSTNAHASPSLGPAAAPGSPMAPSLSAAAGTTTSPNTANSNNNTSGTSGPNMLHHVHYTIQSFVARGEREVALHYIIAIAPYRFPALSSSDRVLALFNQIRFFLPSPRFSTVLMAMEAWRSLYRLSVGASAADHTHMTQELLSLIETYLCHGRTYAEYVSGLLMLRVVLSLAMEHTCLGSHSTALLLQHRALVQERLPTLLLAVWVTLMDCYTIDDLPQPPRRVLRDLAASAMQDLFTVVLELQMVVLAQNVLANAVNVFFSGPQSPPAPAKSATAAVDRHVAPPTLLNSASATNVAMQPPQLQQARAPRRRGESPPLAESSGSNSSASPTAGSGVVAAAAATVATVAAAVSGERRVIPTPLNAADNPHYPQVAAAQTGTTRATRNAVAASLRSPSPPSPTLAAHATLATAVTDAVNRHAASESPAPIAPSSSSRTSYRALTKSVWRSVKQAARRLLSASPSSTSVAGGAAGVAGQAERSSEGARRTTGPTFARGVGRRPGRPLQRTANGPGSQVSATAAAAATTTTTTTSADTTAVRQRLSPAHQSLPLLIEVPDDMLLEMNTDTAAAELMTTPSMPGWAVGSLSVGMAGGGLSSSPAAFPRVTYTPDLLGSATLASAGHDDAPHSPVLSTAPSASTTFHALWQPTFPSSFRPTSWQRCGRGGFAAAGMMGGGFAAANVSNDWNASSNWGDTLWGALPADSVGGGGGNRDALWSMPLALGLRAAGRPLTLESTVAAATLTVGAFLCAWRLVGHGGKDGTADAANDARRTHAGPTPYDSLIPQPVCVPVVSPNAAATAPLVTPFTLPGERKESVPGSLAPTYGATFVASSSAGSRTGQVLPLLTEEQVHAAVVSGEGGSRLASPTSARETGRRGWGDSPVVGRSHSVNASMLSTTLAAMSGLKSTSTAEAATAAEADPEWQSLEEAAHNAYLPAIVDVEAGALLRVDDDSERDRSSGPAATASSPRDERHATDSPAPPPALDAAPTHSETTAKSRSSVSVSSSSLLNAPDLVATAVATRRQAHSPFAAAAASSSEPSLQPQPLSQPHPMAPPSVFATPQHRSDSADGVQRHVDFCDSTTEHKKTSGGARASSPAHGDGVAGADAAPDKSATGNATAAAVAPATPPLFFFLPGWVVTQLVDRCLHPIWDTAAAPSDVHSQTDNATTGSGELSNATAAAGAPLSVDVETEVLMTSLLPLLSQYYSDSFSETQLAATTQALVNNVMKVIRIISQAMHRSTDDAAVSKTLFSATPAPQLPLPQQQQQSQRGATTSTQAANASPGDAAPRHGSMVDPGSLLPSCALDLDHDSAKLDGTELASAVLFICTIAERYPALYQTLVSRKLYPLLHHAMRLMAFEEEPQFWLPTPFASTAAWTAAPSSSSITATHHLSPAPPHQVHAEWMMLTAARSMFQRIAMPALLLIAHNMPSVACAQQCAPLVDRLVQVGLRQPFSSASVTTAACICSVFPSLARICQADIARAMSVVLSTADDFSDEANTGALTKATTADGEADTATTTTAASLRRRRATRTPHSRSPSCQSSRAKAAVAAAASGEDEARRRGGDGGAHPATQRGEQGRLPGKPTQAEVPRHGRASSSFVLTPQPTQLPRRRASAAALHTAQRRSAVQTRLLKHHIFRAVSLIPSTWEGTTLFFLEFCLPYLRHPDAQLRLECVQACTNWPLSDCWHSVARAAMHLTSPPPLTRSPAADGDTLTSASSPLLYAVPSTAGAPFASVPFTASGRHATVSAAVTRGPVRDARSDDNHFGKADPPSSPCYVSFASTNAAAASATAFPAGPLSAARAVGGVKRGQTLSAVAAIARSGAGLPARDSSGLLATDPANNANANVNSSNVCGATSAAATAEPARTPGAAGQLVSDDAPAFRASLPTSAPAATLHTVQHHGRTHINALREIVHHLVEVAVCDPEPLIRRCALESLTPETYQLLYPHEAVLRQLFIVLWDSYLPNRVQAAQLLCALAPLNPPFIYPRLREVMVRYIADMTSNAQRFGHRDGRQRRSGGAAAASAVGILCIPCGTVPEDSLYVLSHIASRLKQSTPLYLPQLLSIIYSVLHCPSSGRGSVLQAMHLLIFLRDDSTQDQSALFDPFVDLIADQLADGEGDTPCVLAAVAALQTLLQSAEPSRCSPQSLSVMVECLHSLLYRKPSVGTEFSMAVLQLLSTISNIEPWQPEVLPQAPALLRRPRNRYAIPQLSSLVGVLGKNSAARALWPVRAELADNAHQALEQIQKADRFMPFMASVWPDTVLRALMRTASGYVNGTMSLTQVGLGECLLAIMNILTNTLAVRHLHLYLPGVLTLVIDLLERRDARPLQSRLPPSPFFITPKNYRPVTVSKESTSVAERTASLPAATATNDTTSSKGGVRGRMHGALSENLWLLFLRSLFDLVLMAGRRIAPMYPLLNVFLRRSWQQTTLRGMVHCCEVLDALCWSVPDLLRMDCDTWITMLLSALMHYDAFVLTHRRAHETAAAATATSTSTNASTGGVGTSGATASMATTTTSSTAAAGARAAAQTRGGATAVGSGSPPLTKEAALHEAFNAAAAAATSTTRSGGAAASRDNKSNTSMRANVGGAAGTAFPPLSPLPFMPVHGPNAVGAAASAGAAQDEAAEASFESQLKLVYRAITMCLTSLQPISSTLMRRLVCMCLSECLKSSYVPKTPQGRRAAAHGTTAKPTHTRQPTTLEGSGGINADDVATHSLQEADLRSPNASAAHAVAHNVFDLMADPHEELISFINTCVCGPLMDYMVHTKLDTVSMKIMKNVLPRLESLSVVHEEALRRAMTMSVSASSGMASSTTTASAPAAAGVRALPESARVICEAHLRATRELLYAQHLRQADDPPLAPAGSTGGQTPTHDGITASATGGSHHGVSGSATPSPTPQGSRAAKEVLWFSNAPLSQLWVQSTDHATTVRRYFPFDAAQTSWETEGEMHLLGCLFAAAAWRHPASTAPFVPVLYSYVAQRFGPESLVMSYMRCVCSTYYVLCVPLLSMSEEEAAAVNWVYENQQRQQQQQQQQLQRHGSAADGGLGGLAGVNGSDHTNAQLRSGATFSNSTNATARMTQDADTSAGTDVILRHPSTARETSLALQDSVPLISVASHALPLPVTQGSAMALNTSSAGSRTGSWEAEAPLRTVVTAEGELTSLTSLSRTRVRAAAASPPSTATRPPICRDTATTAASPPSADLFGLPSPASISAGSGAITNKAASAATTAAITTTTTTAGVHVAAVTLASTHGLLNADDGTDRSNGGQHSAEMNAAASHFCDRSGDAGNTEEEDADGDHMHQQRHAPHQETKRPSSTFPVFSTHLPMPLPQLSPLPPPQPQSQQHSTAAAASTSTATMGGADSLTHTATATTTEIGFVRSSSTRSPTSTHDQSPSAATLPIPVSAGSLNAAMEGRAGFASVSNTIAESGGGSSGPIPIVSSFYPGSFFSSSIADGVASAGNGGSGHQFSNSASTHSGDGRGLRNAALRVGSGGTEAAVGGGGGGGGGNEPSVGRLAALNATATVADAGGPAYDPQQLPFPVAYASGLYLQPPRQPSTSDLTSSSPVSTTTAVMGLSQLPSTMLTVGSYGAAASLSRRRSLLARPNSLFSGVPPAGAGGASSRNTPTGSAGSGSPLWHHPPIPVPASNDDLTYAAAATGGAPYYESLLQPTNTTTTTTAISGNARRHMSPLLVYPPPHHYRSIASATGTANPTVSEDYTLAAAAAGSDGAGAGLHFLPRQLSPLAPTQRSSTSSPSSPSTPVKGGLPWSGAAAAAAAGARPSLDTPTFLKTPLMETRSSGTASPTPFFSGSTPMQQQQQQTATTTTTATPSTAGPALDLHAAAAPQPSPQHPPAAAIGSGDVFLTLPATSSTAYDTSAAVAPHRNALILYFESHRLLRAHGWRSWWEQFCLFMVECSQDYCVKACETFARHHHVAFAYTELLPLALLSTLPSCTVAELTAWLQALRSFYFYHAEPGNSVPLQVTSGVAQLAHEIRLHRNAFFPPEIVSQVIDVWLPDSVVADLAHHSLNPPLRILYLEQHLARAFSWNCTALLLSAMDDVTSSLERKLFVQDRRFQKWLRSLVAGAASKTRSDTTASNAATFTYDSPLGTPDANTRGGSDKNGLDSPVIAMPSSSPSLIDALPPTALELFGFYRAAALKYVRLYKELQSAAEAEAGVEVEDSQQQQQQQPPPLSQHLRRQRERRGCEVPTSSSKVSKNNVNSSGGGGGDNSGLRGSAKPTAKSGVRISVTMPIRTPEKAITAAMRCYVCLYDFEAVLHLWNAVKQQRRSRPRTAALGASVEGEAEQQVKNQNGSSVVTQALQWNAEMARYVALSAQALSRWEYIADTAAYVRAGHLAWSSGALSPLLERFATTTFSSPNVTVSEGGRVRSAKSWPSLAADRWGREEDAVEEEAAATAFAAAASVNASTSEKLRDPVSSSAPTKGSLLEQQQEMFLGAALVAAHDYEGAKQALIAVRDGLRDSYAVFHTSNTRVKLEWSCLFQQLSDLEEGIHALEQAAAVREDGTSLTATTFAAAAAAVPASSESEATTRAAWSGPGSPVLDREVHGRVYPDVTIRRLRNIVCRPLSATMSPLQRFMMIATRSAIAPISWQLDNIVTLCEMLERGGQPMRAVHVLHSYSRQAVSAAGALSSVATTEFQQQLHLETLRRVMRNLSHEVGLRELYADVLTSLRQDLWQSHCAAAARWGQSTSPSLPASASFMWGANSSPVGGTMDPLLAVISDAKRRRGPLLDAQELGPSLTAYQVDLLLLSMTCRRRLTHVQQQQLHNAPLAQRAAAGKVHLHRSDTAAFSTPGMRSSSPRVSVSSSATPVPPHLVGTHHAHGSYCTSSGTEGEVSKRATTTTHRPPQSSETSAAAAESVLHLDQNTEEEEEEEEEDSDDGDNAAMTTENLTGENALFVEYYLLEHAVTVTNYIPSVWREFGLVLFDVCLAIHAEWKATGDDETKQNFLAQSAKAIHGLQLASQLWESGSASALGRGLGPFPAMAQRRHRHARTALPSAHLLLKALNLAITCELIVQNEKQTRLATPAQPLSSKAPLEAAAASSSTSHNREAARSLSPSAGVECSTTAEEASSVNHGLDTVSVSTASASPSSSHHTLQPCDDAHEEKEELAAQTRQRGAHGVENAAHGREEEEEEASAEHVTGGAAGGPPTPSAPLVPPLSPPPSTAAVETAAVGRATGGGFACLDFSAASYAQWAAIAPLLVAAATRYPTIYAALRDMCVRSRHMLRQLIFTLIANFEHGHETLYVQRADQVSRGPGMAGTRTVTTAASAYATMNMQAATTTAAEGLGMLDRVAHHADAFTLQTTPSTLPTSQSVGGVSAVAQERRPSRRRRVTPVPDHLGKDDVGVAPPGSSSSNDSNDSSSSSSSNNDSSSDSESNDAAATTTEVPSLQDLLRRRRRRRRSRRQQRVAQACAAAEDVGTVLDSADTTTTDVKDNDAPSSRGDFTSDVDDKLNSSAFVYEESNSSEGRRPEHRDAAVRSKQQQQQQQRQRQQQQRGRQGSPVSLQETFSSLATSLKEERAVRSLLLAEVAAASLDHHQHVHEAMQLRGFVQRAWDVEATYTRAAFHAAAGGLEAGAAASTSQGANSTAGNSSSNSNSNSNAAAAAVAALDADAVLGLEEANGTLRAMELVLNGHCPLPVPLWLLSSVFGTVAPVDDDDRTMGVPAATTASTAAQAHTCFGNNNSSSVDDDAARRSGGATASKTTTTGNAVAGGRQPPDSRNQRNGADAAAAGEASQDMHPSARGVHVSPSPASSSSAAAASTVPLPPNAARAMVPFSPSTVPGVVHARRYPVSHPAPHHHKEELIFLMLTDGAMCRMRHVAPAVPRAAAADDDADAHQPRSRNALHPHLRAAAAAEASKVSGASTPMAAAVDAEEVRFIVPHSLMEETVSMLLSHFPLTNLQRPFILPLGLQDYITLLPEQTSGSLFGATVTAALMHAEDKKNWKNGMVLLTGESSAALNMMTSLLMPSSASSSARSTPSLHHLMDDYAVHLRVQEMAQAAHDAVERYPTSNFEATYIAAETGRGPGAQSDNSFPFNWAYGYPASAPPSQAAMTATLGVTEHHDVVRQRKMSELRYDHLVAMAYNRGDVEQLVTYVRGLLAAHPPTSPAPTSLHLPPNTTSAPPRDTADDIYAHQQRLYVYLATLPRTEAHLRRLLEALEDALEGSSSSVTVAVTASAPQASSAARAGESEHKSTVKSASPSLKQSQQQQQHRRHRHSGLPPPLPMFATATAVPATSVNPPLILTPQVRQACRLALLRVESSRCKSALADAFRADSSDATHWLEVRSNYAKELAEWSVVQYLFDTYGCECGDVMVNTHDGHVAMHAIGRCSLQKAWSAGSRRADTSPTAAPAATPAAAAEPALSTPATPAAKESDPLTSSPFPTRDSTLFRLTPVLQTGLPMQSPYALFQYHAASVLCDIYLYMRDLMNITTYGVDGVTAFAYTTSPATLEVMAASGGSGGGALPSFSTFSLCVAATAAAGMVSSNTSAATSSIATMTATTTPNSAQRSTLSPAHGTGKTPTPKPLVISVPPTPPLTAEEEGSSDAQAAARPPPPPPPALSLATPPSLCPQAVAGPADVSLSLGNVQAASVPLPPTCFDASSLRLKLSYDIVLMLHADVEQEGREAILRLFKSQREATEASWPQQPFPRPSPTQTRKDEKEEDCLYDTGAVTESPEERPEEEEEDPRSRGAAQSTQDESVAADNALSKNTSPAGRGAAAGSLLSTSFSRTSSNKTSGASSCLAGKHGSTSASATSTPAVADAGGSAPHTTQSAYVLVARLVAAATDEVNLLGVDDVTPHPWRRWAPHW